MRKLRSLLRRLTGPRGRRALALLSVAGLWAWWFWMPPGPRVEWEMPAEAGQMLLLAPDGHTLVDWRERSGPIVLRDVASGRERLRLFTDDPVSDHLHFAPDGSWLIAKDGRKSLRIVSTVDGSDLATFPADDRGNGLVTSWDVAIEPDERGVVLYRPAKQELHVWDAATKRVRLVVPDAFSAAALSPDGRLFAVVAAPGPGVGDVMGTLSLLCSSVPALPTNAIVAPVPNWLIYSRPQILRILDATTGRELARQAFPFSVEFPPHLSADGQRLVWVLLEPLYGCVVQVWDFAAGTPPVTIATCPRLECADAEFTADSRSLALLTRGGVRMWDLAQNPPREQFLRYAVGGFNGIEQPSAVLGGDHDRWLPARRFLWPGPSFDELELWPTGDRNQRIVFRLGEKLPQIPDYAFSADGTTLAVLTDPDQSEVTAWFSEHLGYPENVPMRYRVHLFDARTGAKRGVLSDATYADDYKLLGFSPDGQTLWTGERRHPVIFVVRGWAINSGGPPAWLLIATAVAFLLVIAEWRRGRRRSPSIVLKS